MRRAARTDANQQAIVDRLRACGVWVKVVGQPMDLLVWHKGKLSIMEVKMPDGRFTKAQVEFMAEYPGDILLARTEDEALMAVLGKEVLA